MIKKKRKCPHCGEIIDSNIIECPVCAENIPKEEKKSLKINITLKQILKPLVTFIFLILFIIIGYFSYYKISPMFTYGGACRLGIEYLNNAYAQYLPYQKQESEFDKAYAIATNAIKRNEKKDMAYAIKAAAARGISDNISAGNNIRETVYAKESKQLAEKAIGINPNNSLALMVMADYYYWEKDYDLSLYYINKSIKQNPKIAEIYHRQYWIELEFEQKYSPEDLLKPLNNAIKYAPKDSILLAILYEFRAREKGSIKDYDGKIEDCEMSNKLLRQAKLTNLSVDEIKQLDIHIEFNEDDIKSAVFFKENGI